MKKVFSVFLCLMMLASLILAGAEAPAMAGMPNPVVIVTDDDVFEAELHIEVDADDLRFDGYEMSVIGGKVGQIVFVLTNVNGENVEWTLRFTRDAEMGASMEALTGVYDEDLSEPVVKQADVVDDDPEDCFTLEITEVTANGVGVTIWTWNRAGVFYSLTANGVFSQMQAAEVLDQMMEICFD